MPDWQEFKRIAPLSSDNTILLSYLYTHRPHIIMSQCLLDLEVSALRDRTVFDKSGNKRYVLSGYKGHVAGWGRGSFDVLWRIPKAFGGFYEVLEVRVQESDLRVPEA